MTEQQLKQLFENNSDCYADTWKDGKEGAVVMAMTAERFIEIFYPLLASKPDDQDLETAATEYADRQGVGYPVSKPYQKMIWTQIRAAFKAGSNSAQPSTKTEPGSDVTELLYVLAEYLEFLFKENEAPISIAFNHGWRISKEAFIKGKDYRTKIEELKAKVFNQTPPIDREGS